MPESEAIQRATEPATRASLARDLRSLGLAPGGVVLVHASMSRLGWVCGGAQAVVEALLDALGETGTLMTPASHGGNCDPSGWRDPPVPEAWWPTIREHTPAYDPARSPTRGMGRIAETVLRWPGVRRSPHPQCSFAAVGPRAGEPTRVHPLGEPFGEASPLGGLVRLDGRVLLLGVGHGSNTLLHLAEARSGRCPTVTDGAAVLVDGRRRWVTFEKPGVDDGDFPEVGAAFERAVGLTPGRVAAGEARLLSARAVVASATEWMRSPPSARHA